MVAMSAIFEQQFTWVCAVCGGEEKTIMHGRREPSPPAECKNCSERGRAAGEYNRGLESELNCIILTMEQAGIARSSIVIIDPYRKLTNYLLKQCRGTRIDEATVRYKRLPIVTDFAGARLAASQAGRDFHPLVLV